MDKVEGKSSWICSNHHAVALSERTSRNIDRVATALSDYGGSRFMRESWIRYRAGLTDLPPKPADVRLKPVTSEFIDWLRGLHGTELDHKQIHSGIRFWDAGLRTAYVWFQEGEPLSMQWLLLPSQMAHFPELGQWSGMLPPVPDRCGVVENIYTFRAGRERKGGAASRLAMAVLHQARDRGLREVRTHVPQSNLPAHRWAKRTGFSPFGIIDRYGINLPGLPVKYLYHHQTCAIRYLQALHRVSLGQ